MERLRWSTWAIALLSAAYPAAAYADVAPDPGVGAAVGLGVTAIIAIGAFVLVVASLSVFGLVLLTRKRRAVEAPVPAATAEAPAAPPAEPAEEQESGDEG